MGIRAERLPGGRVTGLPARTVPEGGIFLAAQPQVSLRSPTSCPLTCPGGRGREIREGVPASAPHLCRRHLRVQRLCPPSLLSPSLWPPGHHSCHCLVCPVRTRREGWTQGLWGLLSHRTPVPSHSILSWLMHIFILQILIKSLLCIEHYTNHLRGARRKKKA